MAKSESQYQQAYYKMNRIRIRCRQKRHYYEGDQAICLQECRMAKREELINLQRHRRHKKFIRIFRFWDEQKQIADLLAAPKNNVECLITT